MEVHAPPPLLSSRRARWGAHDSIAEARQRQGPGRIALARPSARAIPPGPYRYLFLWVPSALHPPVTPWAGEAGERVGKPPLAGVLGPDEVLGPGRLSGCGWAPLRALRAMILCLFVLRSFGLVGQEASPSFQTRCDASSPQPRGVPQGVPALGSYNRCCGSPPAPKVGLCGCLADSQPYYVATGGTRQLGKRYR